ncbi:MAG: hypothetical protein ABSG80_08245 [Verrucomicrobiota bacterium]|jgi:hypothetical protein
MPWIIKAVVKFLIVLFVMTIINTIVWEFVAGDLYDCTDGGIPGYWTPGCWVHSWDNHPVVAVHQIVHRRSMSEPDTIKEGWSVASLLCVWFVFFSISLVVGIVLARLPWMPRRRTGVPRC